MGTNRTQSVSGGCLIGELERVTEKEKLKEEIVPDENIISSLPKIPTILDNEDFEIKQELRKQKDEINEEIDLTRLKDEIDFYFGRENDNFFFMWSRLGLNKDNENLLTFCHRTLVCRSSGKTCFRYISKREIFSTITITKINQYTVFC